MELLPEDREQLMRYSVATVLMALLEAAKDGAETY